MWTVGGGRAVPGYVTLAGCALPAWRAVILAGPAAHLACETVRLPTESPEDFLLPLSRSCVVPFGDAARRLVGPAGRLFGSEPDAP